MYEEKYKKLEENLIAIATEMYRFQGVFEKVLGKLELSEQNKYYRQYAWFEKKVRQALDDSNLTVVPLEGKEYDAGMPVTPLNLEDFEPEEHLYIEKVIEPLIMQNGNICKMGTVILGRIDI